jgi:hypothetical protein
MAQKAAVKKTKFLCLRLHVTLGSSLHATRQLAILSQRSARRARAHQNGNQRIYLCVTLRLRAEFDQYSISTFAFTLLSAFFFLTLKLN